jgi:WD40 repeat protein
LDEPFRIRFWTLDSPPAADDAEAAGEHGSGAPAARKLTLKQVRDAHTFAVCDVMWSPHNVDLLATTDSEGKIFVWRGGAATKPVNIIDTKCTEFFACCFSYSDPEIVASSYGDAGDSFVLWNVVDGAMVRHFRCARPEDATADPLVASFGGAQGEQESGCGFISAIAFPSHNPNLLCCLRDRVRVEVWHLNQTDAPIHVIDAPDGHEFTSEMAMSPHVIAAHSTRQSLLAASLRCSDETAGSAATPRQLSFAMGLWILSEEGYHSQLHHVYPSHAHSVISIAWSFHDPQLFATGGESARGCYRHLSAVPQEERTVP